MTKTETRFVMKNGDIVLEEAYSVATGTVLTINTKEKKLYNGDQELIDLLPNLSLRKRWNSSEQEDLTRSYLVKNYRHLLLRF